jgi:hypothetical protein
MRITATLVMGVYLFIVVAYLFFTPKFQYRHITTVRVKTNTQLIYTLIRTNRCMVNENKLTKAKLFINTPVLLPGSISKPLPVRIQNDLALNFLIDHHFAYLSNRVFRI